MGYLQASMVDGIFGMLLITISSNVKASFSLLNVTPTTNKCSKHDIVDIGLYHIAIYFIYYSIFLIDIDFKIIYIYIYLVILCLCNRCIY